MLGRTQESVWGELMNKLYVLIRKDLSKSQQAVQAGHAVAEWVLHSPDKSKWTNGTLIYLSVKSEKDLKKWAYKLALRNIEFEEFFEPDLNNDVTALATLGNDAIFKSLRLMKL